MKSPRYYFFIGVFSTLAVPIVGVIVLVLMVGNSKTDVIDSVPSPKGDHVATLYRYVSGGGATSSCQYQVDIDTLGNEAPSRAQRVFTKRCGGLRDVYLSWVSDTTLNISYKIDRTGMSLFQVFNTLDGCVQITYSVEEEDAP